MKKKLFLMTAVVGMLTVSSAGADIISEYVTSPKKVGEARFSFLFWDVYDAALYTQSDATSLVPPYALELKYLRDLDGAAIAERSIEEMKKQGVDDKQKLSRWEAQMKAIFPDVDDTSVITGIADANNTSHFYLGNDKIGTIDDTEFTSRFFGIWLSKDTSEPKFRAKLLQGLPQ